MKVGKRRQRKQLAEAIDRGHRLFAAGREQEAFDFLQQAVQKFPDDPEIRLHYAISLLAVRPDDAVTEINRAIELGPDEPIRLTRAAGVLFRMGQVETARSYATRAKELAPLNFPFGAYLLNLDGHIAALDGEDELAEERFRRAMEQEPDGETFAADLAKFLSERNRQKEALEIIEQALVRTKRRGPLERLREEMLA